MSTITVSLPDELLSELRAAANRKNVAPDTIITEALANELRLNEPMISKRTVGALVGQDFGKFEGVPDLSTNPAYLDDLGL
jgi:predicted transcriptional regulator